ncbi:uncharacterized protein Smp_203790 [Schistosoma mansoni]|uniref:uncharacterized protein n=1 Tax=Schistosoma mansoni TaxID=6183 RepID=UPI00022DCC3D|nr:uncharacterized protein Smp_203790 [Schistosoma mansoni]|eukprot:XP_018655132.1 uncharacterized protein Smp_203790 [Schistosoma mansoni]
MKGRCAAIMWCEILISIGIRSRILNLYVGEMALEHLSDTHNRLDEGGNLISVMVKIEPRSPIKKQKSPAQNSSGYLQLTHSPYTRKSATTIRSTSHKVVTSTTATNGQNSSELQENILLKKGRSQETTL